MKLNREAVQQRIEEIGDCGCGADKAYLSCPCMNERDEILAEFDRLTAENEKLSTKVATLQAQLDRISEPYHYSRDKADYPWIRHEGKADGCPMCDPKCEHKNQKGE